MLPAIKIFRSVGTEPVTGTLEKSRLRRFFQTTVSLPPAKGVTFAGCLVALHVR
jgi:hypothetical protein